MNVTMKPEIKTRRRDGTWPVYIRVTFKRKTRHIPTTLVCTASDLTRSGRIKAASVLEAADDLVRRMRDALRDVTFFQLETWDVDTVVATIRDAIRGEEFRLDFFSWADGWLDCKTPTTRRTYDRSVSGADGVRLHPEQAHLV